MTQESSNMELPLLVSRDAGILTLTLNRPERRNALSFELYELLACELQAASTERSVGVIVLTGAGGSFCSGGDVKRMAAAESAAVPAFEERVQSLRSRMRIVELLLGMAKPSIAMIRGSAVGAGLSLAAACDFRIGDTTTKMRTGFAQVGLSGDFGGHYFLPKIVGPSKARELYLLSPLLDAAECLRIGLLNQMHEPEQLAPAVTAVAKTLCGWSSVAVGHIKKNLEAGSLRSLSDVLDEEAWRHVRCTESPEHREAVIAFAQRKQPLPS